MRLIWVKGKRRLGFLFLLVIFVSFAAQASAHIPCRCNNPPDQCTCFIQLGDRGLAVERIIRVLKDEGYLAESADKGEFTPEVREAVIRFQSVNNLECTGWMDDETLDALLFGYLPDTSAKLSTEEWGQICFVPTDGGIRYHSDPTCSGMYNPRMISRVNAECLGIEHCGKESSLSAADVLTYSSLGLTPRLLPDDYYQDETDIALSESSITRSLFSDPTAAMYIGNKKSHVFHLESCGSVKKMSEKNKVEFDSRDEAIAEGYKPCSNCNP